MVTRTFTRVHTKIEFANPFLVCNTCKQHVRAFHDPDKCGCDENTVNLPCEHTVGITSICPSWSPIDGCTCEEGH